MNVEAALKNARVTGDFRAVLEAVPFTRLLGLTLETRDERVVICMPFADDLVGNPELPALHGGSLASALEVTAQLEVLRRAESEVLPKTITVTVDYLRSGKPIDTRFAARIVKHGRRVATVHAWAWQEDEQSPIATATVHVLVLPANPAPTN